MVMMHSLNGINICIVPSFEVFVAVVFLNKYNESLKILFKPLQFNIKLKYEENYILLQFFY
jgi:hypothetical protein